MSTFSGVDRWTSKKVDRYTIRKVDRCTFRKVDRYTFKQVDRYTGIKMYGYVYIVRLSNRRVKIGFTRDLHARLTQHRTSLGPLSIIGLQYGDISAERDWHQRFDQYRAKSKAPGVKGIEHFNIPADVRKRLLADLRATTDEILDAHRMTRSSVLRGYAGLSKRMKEMSR
jgi:hypothetical protein